MTTPKKDDEVISDANIPAYPSGLLPENPKFDPPRYDGPKDDLTLRRNVKLYNLWLLWSNLRKDEKLFEILQVGQKEEEKDSPLFYIKSMMVLTLDRMGKILVDTNIVEELKLDETREATLPKKAVQEKG